MTFSILSWARSTLSIRDTTRADDGHTEIVSDCPHCGRQGKLYVNAKTGKFVCFYCEKRGSIEYLVSLVECISMDEARAKVSAGAILPPRLGHDSDLPPMWWERSRDVKSKPRPEPLPEDFTPVLNPKTGDYAYPAYLKQRGISRKTCAKFGIGYSQRGRYANRVVLPVTRNGTYQGFTSRACDDFIQPKYLTSDGMDKPRVLYGLDQAFLEQHVVLVEGPFDVLYLSQRGFPAACLQGKTFSWAQYQMLVKSGTTTATVILDSDDPTAWHASVRICREFAAHGAMAMKVGRLPRGYDPATSTVEMIHEALGEARAPTMADEWGAKMQYLDAVKARRRRVA